MRKPKAWLEGGRQGVRAAMVFLMALAGAIEVGAQEQRAKADSFGQQLVRWDVPSGSMDMVGRLRSGEAIRLVMTGIDAACWDVSIKIETTQTSDGDASSFVSALGGPPSRGEGGSETSSARDGKPQPPQDKATPDSASVSALAQSVRAFIKEGSRAAEARLARLLGDVASTRNAWESALAEAEGATAAAQSVLCGSAGEDAIQALGTSIKERIASLKLARTASNVAELAAVEARHALQATRFERLDQRLRDPDVDSTADVDDLIATFRAGPATDEGDRDPKKDLRERSDAVIKQALLIEGILDGRRSDALLRVIPTYASTGGVKIDVEAKRRHEFGGDGSTVQRSISLRVEPRRLFYISTGWMVSKLTQHQYERVELPLAQPDGNGKNARTAYVDRGASKNLVNAPLIMANVVYDLSGEVLKWPFALGLGGGLTYRAVNSDTAAEALFGVTMLVGDALSVNLGWHWGRVQTIDQDVLNFAGDLPDEVAASKVLGETRERAFALSVGVKLP